MEPFSLKGAQELDDIEREELARVRAEILFENAARDVPRILEQLQRLHKEVANIGSFLAPALVAVVVLLAGILWRVW